jgi:hypothetical protein
MICDPKGLGRKNAGKLPAFLLLIKMIHHVRDRFPVPVPLTLSPPVHKQSGYKDFFANRNQFFVHKHAPVIRQGVLV